MRTYAVITIALLVSLTVFPILTHGQTSGWNVTLTASGQGYSDAATFGVRNNATLTFDLAYDEVHPPPPPGGIVSYFRNPNDPSIPGLDRLSTSMIAPSEAMTWTYVLQSVSIDGSVEITWATTQIAAIPSVYKVLLLTETNTTLANMRIQSNHSFTVKADEIYTFRIVVTTLNAAVNVDAEKPVANSGQKQTVDAGTPVIFDADSSTDNVGIVSYEWNFGDQTTDTGKTVTHTYNNPGVYTVALTVKDAANNADTDQITITVQAEPGLTQNPYQPPSYLVILLVIVLIIITATFAGYRMKKPPLLTP